MKHKAKKSSASERIERCKTGGGTFVSPIDDVDTKMLSLLGHRAVPLTNFFDSDASYNADESMYSFHLYNTAGMKYCTVLYKYCRE